MAKSRIVTLWILLFILTAYFPSYAAKSTYDLHIAKGISYVETNDYKNAIDEFKTALSEKPDDPIATLYLGIALSRAGNSEAETTLKKALALNPGEPRTNLELGIYYFSKGVYDEAKDYFENTLQIAPNTEFSSKSADFLRLIKERSVVKPWTVNISAGGQYDSNVILNPDDSSVPGGISRRADWKAIVYLRGKYNLITRDKAESSVGYSLYQSLHSSLNEYDITQHLLELKGSYNISPLLTLKGGYAYEYVLVGGDRYDYANSISPSLVISEGGGYTTVIDYRYRDARYQDAVLFASNSDRTGTNNLFGITQNIPIQANLLARVSYSHDEERTRLNYWNYRGNKGSAGLRFNIPGKILENTLMELTGEYYSKYYEGKNPTLGIDREDNTYTGSVSATKQLLQNYSLTLSYLYTSNDSNTESYNYKRQITSAFLNLRF
ncbi:MAG: tetratricopeptide repeat protein [Nitrospirae bacterium]|nr:tetratricopeptide repeat protein [Nitrospirota bacterium]